MKIIRLFIITAFMLFMGAFSVQAAETEETILVNTSWLEGELLRVNVEDSETDAKFALEIRLSDYISEDANDNKVIVVGDSPTDSEERELSDAETSQEQYLHLRIMRVDSESTSDEATEPENTVDTSDAAQSESSVDTRDVAQSEPSAFEPLDSESFEALKGSAEKYLNKPYVWGGSSPETSFDCSGLAYWTLNESGVAEVERTTAQGYYDMSMPVAEHEVSPGDFVFFHTTYPTESTVTHMGIYTGNNYMIHAGDPIKYEYIDTDYWQKHLYGFGRINPNKPITENQLE